MQNRPVSLIRLAGLPLSLTLLSILAGSVINRVMVVELGLPVILAGLFIAIPLLISPVRIWLGHLSDAYPLWGRRREPYLMLGALLSGFGVALSVALVVQTPPLASGATAWILLGLLLYGVGRNLTGNTFQALLTDRFAAGVARARAANLYEVIKLLTVLGTQMQDVLMEPYAGLVLGMDVAATTRLTMFWGLGALASILLSGLVLVRWLGLARLYRLGIGLLLPLFVLVVLAGVLQRPLLLQLSVLGLGLSSGLAAASLLAQAVEFTSARSAGLLLGVWGLGFQLGRALASVLGAGLVDLMNLMTDDAPLLAYGAGFAVEAALLMGALLAYGRLRLRAACALSGGGH
ncbi:PucC family protein [uncultured Thiohalocapsa sp.]|uniref:PucC family protein n=1 Tax=uncultured Thiohalocapsa sp. TaxID=768990 RepID=UPI0025EBAA3B|nr:PucC family protein [uncultured Thiohalocapsa sp.]